MPRTLQPLVPVFLVDIKPGSLRTGVKQDIEIPHGSPDGDIRASVSPCPEFGRREMPFFLEMILPVRHDEQTVLRVDLEGNALVDEIATEQSVKPAAGDLRQSGFPAIQHGVIIHRDMPDPDSRETQFCQFLRIPMAVIGRVGPGLGHGSFCFLCCPEAHLGPRVENHRPDPPSDFYRDGDQSIVDRDMQRVRKIMLQDCLAGA